MIFNDVKKYQKNVIKLLDHSFNKNRLVHTYLFVGNRGTFKKETALYLASLILCENKGACGECKQCKDIRKNCNQNVFVISPDGQNIKKEQILALEHEFSLTSDSKRVYIIEHIDRASIASANSLLKFLEDAKDNTYGILITENPNMVLPTIKSRSQIIQFVPINRSIVFHELLNKKVEKELAAVISTITNDIDEALDLSQDSVFLNIISLVKELSISFENNIDESAFILNEKGKFLFRETKIYHDYFLSILITLQNDKIKYLLNSNDDIVFSHLLDECKLTLQQTQQIEIMEILMAVKSKLKYHLNMELAYLQMVIDIARCTNG